MQLKSSKSQSQMEVVPFFEKESSTFSYIVKDPESSACAVIDPVLDFDYASGEVSYGCADQMIAYIVKHKLEIELLLETHVHADHLSAAPYIQSKLGGKIAIGKTIVDVQEIFGKVFNEGTEFERDGSQFDILFDDLQSYSIGSLEGVALHTPGHTPACMSHVIGDAMFVGDTLFMPDSGTARADFPGGDARELYQSIHRLLQYPDQTRIFVCHDYQPGGREVLFETSVGEQRLGNIHVNDSISEDEFVELREKKDSELGMPRLILPSLQVNMRAGNFPSPEDNEVTYLKVPLIGLSSK